ncbi:MAG: alpha-rhamnosidase, partial [Bacteroidota bacterium]
MRRQLVLLMLVLLAVQLHGQPWPPWKAKWIAAEREESDAYGVYVFRKTFSLDRKPETFPVQISADNRYKLYVNGVLASLGPARGDLYYWNYESVDIAPFLNAGNNVLAALVWNEGQWRPEAQMTFQTGFILNGASGISSGISTDERWKWYRQTSYQPIPVHVNAYYVAGPGERIDMNQHLLGWETLQFDDSNWKQAVSLGNGVPKGVFIFDYRWMLVPSSIPPMELKPERFASVRRSSGVKVPDGFPSKKIPLTISPKTTAVLLLDNSRLTNAYMNLRWSGGSGARISLIYTESLVDSKGVKGDRNAVDGKTIAGRTDSLLSSGKPGQTFTSLWWRTYRYVELNIQTGKDPLVLEDVEGTFTGYPFTNRSAFSSSDPVVPKILETGWHTARLCAVETYMDCPYYEQLQYIGDTRIQALVSYYVSGDSRLARNAIDQMEHSAIAEGITLSRHPSFTPQIIPTFSLWYIHMLEEFRMHNDDEAYIASKLASTRQVLAFFRKYAGNDGSLRNIPYWVFTDWVDRDGWNGGVGPMGKDGSSAIVDIQYLWTLQVAARLEADLGLGIYADAYRKEADLLASTIRDRYWDSARGIFADTQERNVFSQHANALAILSGLVTGDAARALAANMLEGKEMAEASIYFKYYLHRAAAAAG